MTPIRSALASMLLLISTATLATEQWHTSTIKFVYPLDTGDFVIGFDSDSTLCTSTASPKYYHVYVGQNGMTASGSAKIYAAALTALATRQVVAVAFDDASASCWVNRMSVSN